jgi:hypothetical protein
LSGLGLRFCFLENFLHPPASSFAMTTISHEVVYPLAETLYWPRGTEGTRLVIGLDCFGSLRNSHFYPYGISALTKYAPNRTTVTSSIRPE